MIGGPLMVLLALIGVVATVVWIVRWANDYRRTRTALDILDERFARGEIDKAEYDEKHKLILVDEAARNCTRDIRWPAWDGARPKLSLVFAVRSIFGFSALHLS